MQEKREEKWLKDRDRTENIKMYEVYKPLEVYERRTSIGKQKRQDGEESVSGDLSDEG